MYFINIQSTKNKKKLKETDYLVSAILVRDKTETTVGFCLFKRFVDSKIVYCQVYYLIIL